MLSDEETKLVDLHDQVFTRNQTGNVYLALEDNSSQILPPDELAIFRVPLFDAIDGTNARGIHFRRQIQGQTVEMLIYEQYNFDDAYASEYTAPQTTIIQPSGPVSLESPVMSGAGIFRRLRSSTRSKFDVLITPVTPSPPQSSVAPAPASRVEELTYDIDTTSGASIHYNTPVELRTRHRATLRAQREAINEQVSNTTRSGNRAFTVWVLGVQLRNGSVYSRVPTGALESVHASNVPIIVEMRRTLSMLGEERWP